MNKNLLMGAGVFLAIIIVGFFLVGSPKKATSPEVTPQPEEGVVNETPTPAGSSFGEVKVDENIREVRISGNEYSYNPASLTLTKGEKISLTFTNVGNILHNLVIDELNVSTKTVAGGKSDTVEFTAEKSGTFSFYCNIGNHRSLGMEGEVEVK